MGVFRFPAYAQFIDKKRPAKLSAHSIGIILMWSVRILLLIDSKRSVPAIRSEPVFERIVESDHQKMPLSLDLRLRYSFRLE